MTTIPTSSTAGPAAMPARPRLALPRLPHHEFWPPWLFYAPIVPYVVALAIRHRHALAFTCCNRGITPGGGFIGESKTAIQHAIPNPDGSVLAAFLIPAGPPPRERARRAMDLVAQHDTALRFPVILKPDAAFRGFGLKLARNEHDVAAYFERYTRDTQLQAYHPGPEEVGIVWVRDRRTITEFATPRRETGEPPRARLAGRIYAVTRKRFPVLIGDGVSTLERLIAAHPRFSRQSAVFLSRFHADRTRILAAGEMLRLAEAGNHCQGVRFSDSADLITPELEARIDRLARGFASPQCPMPSAQCLPHLDSHQLDFMRLDLRYTSDDDLRAGRFDGGRAGIVELNGVTAEATNLYDPDRSLLWSYRVLAGQWRRLFTLGAARREQGAVPMRIRDAINAYREYYRDRPGSAVSD